jgi:ATP-binding cassette subfamily B protein
MASKCSASANRVAEILNCEDTLKERSEEEFPRNDNGSVIEFKDVDFSYIGVKKDLTDISFKIKEGESLGIIGATGSGKSTVIKLLLRFYDVGSGAIYIDGKDIRTIDRKELYSYFGTVMQNDFLYNDTIYENIKFGRDLSDEQIKTAAKIAQADGFITDFEDGYEHILSQKGTNISGGQKQRILISRAIASKPRILILDDSSSALDYKTESNLRKALNENFKDTILINVAQRVSAVKNCTQIIVLENGEIIGMGTHEELLNNCSEYKEISDSQMGGAIVE